MPSVQKYLIEKACSYEVDYIDPPTWDDKRKNLELINKI